MNEFIHEPDCHLQKHVGWTCYGAAWRLQTAEADFIAATRHLDRVRLVFGLEHLSVKDLASLNDGGQSSEQSETEGDGQSDSTTHDVPPMGLDVPDRTIGDKTIELLCSICGWSWTSDQTGHFHTQAAVDAAYRP